MLYDDLALTYVFNKEQEFWWKWKPAIGVTHSMAQVPNPSNLIQQNETIALDWLYKVLALQPKYSYFGWANEAPKIWMVQG
mgnify:FL=1